MVTEDRGSCLEPYNMYQLFISIYLFTCVQEIRKTKDNGDGRRHRTKKNEVGSYVLVRNMTSGDETDK